MSRYYPLFIQDMQEFWLSINPALQEVLETYQWVLVSQESYLHWLIEEQIENVHGIIVQNHDYRNHQYGIITAYLKTLIDVDRFTRYYLRVPRVYGDDSVRVTLSALDLYIEYISHRHRFRISHEFIDRLNAHPELPLL